MKKIFVSLAALVMSASAFAQSATLPATSVAFEVENQQPILSEDGEMVENAYTISTLNPTVTFTLKDYKADLGYAPIVLYYAGGGFGMAEPTMDLPAQIGQSEFAFGVTKAAWGNPYMGNYILNIMVAFMDLEEGDFFYVDDEPLMFNAVYTCANTSPAELVSVYPNNNWEEETFAQAYAHGEIRFNFSNDIEVSEKQTIGELTYIYFDGSYIEVDIVNGDNATAAWNPLDGWFTISIDYAITGVSANEISEIYVELDQLDSKGERIEIDPVMLENDNPNMKRGAKKAALEENMVSANESVSVYNVAGVCVKSNISQSDITNLPKGLYIINGKKIVVK